VYRKEVVANHSLNRVFSAIQCRSSSPLRESLVLSLPPATSNRHHIREFTTAAVVHILAVNYSHNHVTLILSCVWLAVANRKYYTLLLVIITATLKLHTTMHWRVAWNLLTSHFIPKIMSSPRACSFSHQYVLKCGNARRIPLAIFSMFTYRFSFQLFSVYTL
jgi:hypothetical protein